MKFFLFVFLLFTVGCQSSNNSTSDVTSSRPEIISEDSLSLPDDFIAFYQQFHDDSIYQLAHIIFPLAGVPANADTITDELNEFKWQQANWKIHRPFDNTLTGYSKTFSKFEDGIVIENIVQKQVGVGMERRFAKMDDEWMLIYYAGMNYLH